MDKLIDILERLIEVKVNPIYYHRSEPDRVKKCFAEALEQYVNDRIEFALRCHRDGVEWP